MALQFGQILFEMEADLERAKVGRNVQVLLSTMDKSKAKVHVPLETLKARVALPKNKGGVVALEVKRCAEVGTYEANYVPSVRGDHVLEILFYDRPVTNTLFEVHEGVSVRHTMAHHVHDDIFVGQEGNLVIEAANEDGTLNHLGEDAFEVSIVTSTAHPGDIRMFEGEHGRYVVRYTFYDAGRHQISITMNGEHIGNSPLIINVKPPYVSPTITGD